MAVPFALPVTIPLWGIWRAQDSFLLTGSVHIHNGPYSQGPLVYPFLFNLISMEQVSQDIIDLALHHQTDDNASVVVFHLRKLIPVSSEEELDHQKPDGWFQKLRKLVS
jgi:hypothetical protein